MKRKKLPFMTLLGVLLFCRGALLSADEHPTVENPMVFGKNSLQSMIIAAASRYGIDPDLVQAMVSVESAYDPLAVSAKGAIGLMQLMPETAARYGVSNPFNPRENIIGGIRYLHDLLIRFENLRHALAAYNAGENAIKKYGGIPPYRETRNYVKKVIDRYQPGQGPYFSASVPLWGRRANEVGHTLGRARSIFGDSGASGRRDPSQAPKNSSATALGVRALRPVVEVNRGPLVYLKKFPRRSIQLRVPPRTEPSSN